MEYQVQSYRGRYVVDMRNRTCACGSWQLSGIPCQHAIACMKMNNDPPERYMDDCYRVDTCKKAYSFAVLPLNDSSQWIHDDCIDLESPIFQEKKRGPRQKKRRKEAWEVEKAKKVKKGRAYTAMSKG
ncbi:unnamed protein product [Linum trigynum]|uniref:SWIM-type domain-containing protein n=1 Tax=Linum trigynum TaxID=586398 RepID=A0AAV2FDJ6_9ROSI